jgi:hypothetical protein
MTHRPITISRQRSVSSCSASPSQTTPISARTFGWVLVLLYAFGVRAASAQSAITLSTNTTSSSPLVLKAGTYGAFTTTATPASSFTGTVSLTCTNLPANAQCEFPGANSGLAVNNAASTMTISLNTSTVYNYASNSRRTTLERVALCGLSAPALGLLLLGRRRRWMGSPALRALVFLLALCPLAGLAGCGTTQPQFTPTGSYTFGIVGRYSNLTTNTATVYLTVN